VQRNIVQQAATVFELLHWRGRTDLVPLQLWLLGYNIPISRVRSTLLYVMERRITAWTQGVDAADTDELEDALSELAVRASVLRGRSASVALDMPRAARASLIELLSNIGFNAAFQPDHTTLSELLQGIRTAHQVVNQDHAEAPVSADTMVSKVWQPVILFAQVHLNRVHHRDVIARAPEALFAVVQDDFGLLRDVLGNVLARHGFLRSPLKFNVVGNYGFMLIPVLLSLREAGYAPWIDYGRAVLSQFLRPALQDALARDDPEALEALLEAPTVVPSIKPIDALIATLR
jgi:hypothetical protein